MPQRLLNKVAVVTGASGRLGRAVVEKFVSEGAKVVLFARDRGPLEEVAALAPARILVVPGDVTRAADLELLADTTRRRMGGVDVLVPAASSFRPARLSESGHELVAEIFAVNFHGALQTIRAFERQFNPKASIVTISASPTDSSRAGWGPFVASKAALAALTRTLAIELSPRDIRTNCVAPAGFDVNSTADMRVVTEVAQTVLFLACDESAGISGQEIIVGATPGERPT